MNDMSGVITPKSDQINADDLISGPMTITIRDVQIKGGTEQPVSIAMVGTDKFYRPCKSMSRVMVANWGPDAKAYIGRSLTLYRDPDVQWGGMKVGGIRISHMSNIEAPITLALTATRANRKPFTVRPLEAPTAKAADSKPDPAATWAAAYIAKLATLTTIEAVRAFEAEKATKLAEMQSKRPELHQSIVAAIAARVGYLDEADPFASDDFAEGPAEEQRGETHTETDPNRVKAEEWITAYEADVKAAKSMDALTAIHAKANVAAAKLKREYPVLYAARLAGLRPADAPEMALAGAE